MRYLSLSNVVRVALLKKACSSQVFLCYQRLKLGKRLGKNLGKNSVLFLLIYFLRL